MQHEMCFRLGQTADREPPPGAQSCPPSHASSMPELPPPPVSLASSIIAESPGVQPTASTSTSPSTQTTNVTTNNTLSPDVSTPTLRRVRFQGDDTAGSSSSPLSADERIQQFSPSTSKLNVPRSRSLQPEEVAGTSWSKFINVNLVLIACETSS